MAERTRQEVISRSGYSLRIVALFILILLGAGLSLPQRAVAVVPIVLVAVVTVRELRRLHREGAPRTARFGPFLTLGFVALLLFVAMAQVAVYVPQKAYEDCMAGANTQAAQVDCSKQRQQNVVGNILQK